MTTTQNSNTFGYKISPFINGGTVLSLLLLIIIGFSNPPVIEDIEMFALPGDRMLILCLGILMVFFYYGWLGLLLIKYKYFKKLEWGKIGKMLLLYALFIFTSYGITASVMSSGHITGYIYYKRDAWDTYVNCFAPVYLFERFTYYLPFVFAGLAIYSQIKKKSWLLLRYSFRLLPLFMSTQIVVILYFSNRYRTDLEFVNGVQEIPADLIQYMPKEDAIRYQNNVLPR